MNEELIRLCCQEFASYAAAQEANPYRGASVIRYHAPIEPATFVGVDFEPPQIMQASIRQICLRQLPSGFWAWLPEHPDDIARLAEFKNNDIQFGQGKILQARHEIPLHYAHKMPQEEKNHLFERLRYELFREFNKTLDLDTIYKIAISQHEGITEQFGGSIVLSCRMIACAGGSNSMERS